MQEMKEKNAQNLKLEKMLQKYVTKGIEKSPKVAKFDKRGVPNEAALEEAKKDRESTPNFDHQVQFESQTVEQEFNVLLEGAIQEENQQVD